MFHKGAISDIASRGSSRAYLPIQFASFIHGLVERDASKCFAKAIASGKIAAAVIAVAIMAPCDPTASPNIPKTIGAIAPAPIVPV